MGYQDTELWKMGKETFQEMMSGCLGRERSRGDSWWRCAASEAGSMLGLPEGSDLPAGRL